MKPMTREAVTGRMPLVAAWSVDDQFRELRREFRFKNYYETMAFVNAVAWIAHAADHHPDLEVGYNRCVVRYSTHDAGGLTEKDFASVLKVEAL
ncbi:MAG TPA: 4a-hydroxytetrahydrobiopterin dehydratase [Candidatus Polarisedimenticolaceae bacterium]